MERDFYCDEILTRKVQVKIVHETENILAFYHTKPSFPLHIVIIPKAHTLDLTTCIEDLGDIIPEMMDVLKIVIQKVMNQYGGCRLTTNFGKFQQTRHLHWHVYINNEMM